MLPLILAATMAATAAPVTSGYGWEMGGGVTHIDSTYWSIQFYDTYSRDRLAFYMDLTSAELEKSTGVKFNVMRNVINPSSTACPGHTRYGGHRLIVRLSPYEDRSNATICSVNGKADSSRVIFSKDRWYSTTRDGSKYSYRRNVSSHELGHSVGLGHAPNCSLWGADPLMCGTYWGGYGYHYDAHKYTPYDVDGLKQLVLNRP